MKALLILTLGAFTFMLNAQDTSLSFLPPSLEEQHPQTANQLEYPKYRGLFLGLGPRFLNTDPGQIVTSFIDDSPSMDNFNSNYTVKDGYTQIGIQFGYKFGRYKGLSHDILFDIAVGDNNTFNIGYALGYNFLTYIGSKHLLIRPALQGIISNTIFNLGEIQNNAAYIQVGEVQYYERALDVNLRSQSATFALKLDFTYKMLDRVDVFFKTAYDFPAGNSNPNLELSVPSGLRSDESPGDSSLNIDGDNPLITYNGEKLESLPYTTGGLRATIGVSYLWNRR